MPCLVLYEILLQQLCFSGAICIRLGLRLIPNPTLPDIGGALRLGGGTTIRDCSFVSNMAANIGLAVAAVGSAEIYDSEFRGNVFSCREGEFLHTDKVCNARTICACFVLPPCCFERLQKRVTAEAAPHLTTYPIYPDPMHTLPFGSLDTYPMGLCIALLQCSCSA